MKPHDEWLFKASQDLESAKLLASSDKRPLCHSSFFKKV